MPRRTDISKVLIIGSWEYRTQACCFLIVLLLTSTALGCVVVPKTHLVPKSFSVVVSNEVGPVAGLRLKVVRLKSEELLKLSGEEQRRLDPGEIYDELASATTNSNGEAEFEMSREGSFILQPDHPAGGFWVDIIVHEGNNEKKVDLTWPAAPILKTVRVEGTLIPPLPSGSKLRLSDALSTKPIGLAEVAPNGSFFMKRPAPGLYMLSIIPAVEKNDSVEGHIFLQVDYSAVDQPLEIGIAMTSCGLMYSPRCRDMAPITVDSLCGMIVDPEGAVIENVGLVLLQHGLPIAKARSDFEGRFQFAVPPGSYDFQIDAASLGFAAARADVSIQGGSCNKSLTITLPVIGFGSPNCTWNVN